LQSWAQSYETHSAMNSYFISVLRIIFACVFTGYCLCSVAHAKNIAEQDAVMSCPHQGLPLELDHAWDKHNTFAYEWLVNQRDACQASGNADATRIIDQMLEEGARAITLISDDDDNTNLSEVLAYLQNASHEHWLHDVTVFVVGGSIATAVIVVAELACCICLIGNSSHRSHSN